MAYRLELELQIVVRRQVGVGNEPRSSGSTEPSFQHKFSHGETLHNTMHI